MKRIPDRLRTTADGRIYERRCHGRFEFFVSLDGDALAIGSGEERRFLGPLDLDRLERRGKIEFLPQAPEDGAFQPSAPMRRIHVVDLDRYRKGRTLVSTSRRTTARSDDRRSPSRANVDAPTRKSVDRDRAKEPNASNPARGPGLGLDVVNARVGPPSPIDAADVIAASMSIQPLIHPSLSVRAAYHLYLRAIAHLNAGLGGRPVLPLAPDDFARRVAVAAFLTEAFSTDASRGDHTVH